VLEPFVDIRGSEVGDRIAQALRRSPKLRKAFRGAIVSSLPSEIEEEPRSIAQRDEHMTWG
jgi:hypothetical protein